MSDDTITLGNKKEAAAARLRSATDRLKQDDSLGKDRVALPDIQMLQAQRAAEVADKMAGGLTTNPDGTLSVTPRPKGAAILSPQTAEQLSAVQQAAVKEEEKEEAPVEEEEDLFSLLSNDNRNDVQKALGSKKRRNEIESRCAPLRLEDLIMKDEVRQRVIIIPGKLEVVFRSITPAESLFIKKYLSVDKEELSGYLNEKLALCGLVCALVSINDVSLPDHMNSDGKTQQPLFEKKLQVLMKKPSPLVWDLAANCGWFELRIQKMLLSDAVGNG